MLTTLCIISLDQGKIAQRYDREPDPVDEAGTVEAKKAHWFSMTLAAAMRSVNSVRFGHKATVSISHI